MRWVHPLGNARNLSCIHDWRLVKKRIRHAAENQTYEARIHADQLKLTAQEM